MPDSRASPRERVHTLTWLFAIILNLTSYNLKKSSMDQDKWKVKLFDSPSIHIWGFFPL